MFCEKCGALLNEGAKFCSACGNSVENVKAQPQEPAAFKLSGFGKVYEHLTRTDIVNRYKAGFFGKGVEVTLEGWGKWYSIDYVMIDVLGFSKEKLKQMKQEYKEKLNTISTEHMVMKILYLILGLVGTIMIGLSIFLPFIKTEWEAAGVIDIGGGWDSVVFIIASLLALAFTLRYWQSMLFLTAIGDAVLTVYLYTAYLKQLEEYKDLISRGSGFVVSIIGAVILAIAATIWDVALAKKKKESEKEAKRLRNQFD